MTMGDNNSANVLDLQHPAGFTAQLLWVTISLAATAFLITASIIYFLVLRRSWRDTSWKIRRLAPRKVKKEKVVWLQPYQYLSRLPETDYIRSRSSSNGKIVEELHVPLLPDEALYANMTLNLSSYYSRVYAFDSCTDQDVVLLQQSLRRALGAYPILAGRCRRNTKRNISVVLPVDCLLSDEEKNSNVKSGLGEPDEEQESDTTDKENNNPNDEDPFLVGRKRTCGVPFRVLHVLPEDRLNEQIENHELTPLDVGRYSIYEDQHRIVKGHAPLMTVTLYRFQKSGKAVLTLTVSHGVMDGCSMARFEAMWAKESHVLAELDPPTGGGAKNRRGELEETQPSSSSEDGDDECHSVPEQYTMPSLPPVDTVVPVSRQELPPPYETMEEYKAAQIEFLGEVIDGYGRDIRGNCVQKLIGWVVIELGLPLLKLIHDGLFLLGLHPNLHRPVVNLSQENLQHFKQTSTPESPDEWVATNDALAAVLVKKVVELKQSRGTYKKHRARVVLWRDSRGYLQQDPLHAYGMGMFMFPFVIDEPHTKSTSEIALLLRQRLHHLQTDPEMAARFWRMNTTVLSLRLWAFLPYVTSLYDFRRSDVLVLLNNSTFPLPHFAGSMGCATSTSTQAGPSVLLQAQQEEDGAAAGCRLILDEDIKKVLKPKVMRELIASAQHLKDEKGGELELTQQEPTEATVIPDEDLGSSTEM